MRILFLSILILLSATASSQSYWSPGVTYYHGAMFKYLKSQPWLNFTGLQGVELKVTKHTRGDKAWHAYHNYPKLKLGLSYFDYGVPKYFGQYVTGVLGLNYGFWGTKNLRWTPGFGLGYNTKYYSPENKVNKAVSTRLVFCAELDLVYTWRLSDHLTNELSLSFRHASNGNFKKPNYGMNFVAAGLSINFDAEKIKKKSEFFSHSDHEDIKTFRYFLIYTTGWKDPQFTRKNSLYQVQSLSLFAAYRFSNINSFLIGLDGFIDTSQYWEYINQTEDETPPFDEHNFDPKQLAFTIGNTFHFGRLGIIAQGGLFLYRPYKFMKFSYQRYGFQYSIGKHLVLQSALKAYFGSADVVEFGAGFTI